MIKTTFFTLKGAAHTTLREYHPSDHSELLQRHSLDMFESMLRHTIVGISPKPTECVALQMVDFGCVSFFLLFLG